MNKRRVRRVRAFALYKGSGKERRQSSLVHLNVLATIGLNDNVVTVTTVDSGVQDSLVRDQAAAEVVLEAKTNEESHDPASPVSSSEIVSGIVRGNDGNLNDLQNSPDQGTDDKAANEAIHPKRLLLVDTSETISRHNSHSQVQDSDHNENSTVET